MRSEKPSGGKSNDDKFTHVESVQRLRRPWKARLTHAARVGMFAALMAVIHLHCRTDVVASRRSESSNDSILIADVGSNGLIIRTLPKCHDIIGFSGPTDVAIAIDQSNRIAEARILSSGDTVEHVEQIRQSKWLDCNLVGLDVNSISRFADVDAVSGATLTCGAIQESVVRTISGRRISRRFPGALQLDRVRTWYPDAVAIQVDDDNPMRITIVGENGPLATAMRTSPAADGIIGYQGPTEAVWFIDDDDVITGGVVRRSYDNEPYVGYVRDDAYFWKAIVGSKLSDVAQEQSLSNIEGVSGATMTSMAVVDGLRAAARQHVKTNLMKSSNRRLHAMNINWRDVLSLIVIGLGVSIAMSPVRGRRKLRIAYQAILIGYLGLLQGHLLSLAMFAGWARSGVPYTRAWVLLTLSVIAFTLPIFAGRNVYCSHLCPHGAVQMWLRPGKSRRLRLSPTVQRWAKTIPVLLLLLGVIVTIGGVPFSLVNIEPFDAYVFRLAGAATLTIAAVGLILSAFSPMAYCRYGCPTGGLLKYLRRHSQSDRWTGGDTIAMATTIVAAIWMISHR